MDNSAVLQDLRAATDEFLAALEGCSRSEWGWKPAPEAWSVGEVAEHTCTVQRGIERLFTTKLLEQPRTEESPALRWSDADLPRLMGDGRKVRAPEMVLPKGRWSTREELVAAFDASTETLIAWVRQHSVDLRAYGSTHPLLGSLDGVQWLIFVAAHTRRHGRQVVALRARYAEGGG